LNDFINIIIPFNQRIVPETKTMHPLSVESNCLFSKIIGQGFVSFVYKSHLDQ